MEKVLSNDYPYSIVDGKISEKSIHSLITDNTTLDDLIKLVIYKSYNPLIRKYLINTDHSINIYQISKLDKFGKNIIGKILMCLRTEYNKKHVFSNNSLNDHNNKHIDKYLKVGYKLQYISNKENSSTIRALWRCILSSIFDDRYDLFIKNIHNLDIDNKIIDILNNMKYMSREERAEYLNHENVDSELNSFFRKQIKNALYHNIRKLLSNLKKTDQIKEDDINKIYNYGKYGEEGYRIDIYNSTITDMLDYFNLHIRIINISGKITSLGNIREKDLPIILVDEGMHVNVLIPQYLQGDQLKL